MHLLDEPFILIRDKKKRFEFRLNDDKRKAVRVGDTIIFVHCDTEERLQRTVRARHDAPSFADLPEHIPGRIKKRPFYSEEDQRRLGVVAFELE